MWRCRPIAPRTDTGFTLLELMVVLSLCGLFFGVVYDTVLIGLRAAHAADTREGVRQQLTNAMDRLTREASLAKTVRQATSSLFEFDADLTGDGTVETNILYQVQSGNLVRTYGGATITLVRNVTSGTLSYFKQDRVAWVSGTDALTSIRVVQISLTATNAATNWTESLSLTTSTYLRSM